MSISATPYRSAVLDLVVRPGKRNRDRPGRRNDERIHHDQVLVRREAVRPERHPRVLGAGQAVDQDDSLVAEVDRRAGSVEDLDELAVVGSDVVVVDLVEDEVGYCRSVSGTARRLRRETGPENQSEQGRDDENVPGEVVHAANLDTA